MFYWFLRLTEHKNDHHSWPLTTCHSNHITQNFLSSHQSLPILASWLYSTDPVVIKVYTILEYIIFLSVLFLKSPAHVYQIINQIRYSKQRKPFSFLAMDHAAEAHRTDLMTITRHVLNEQSKHPEARGAFTILLNHIVLGCKFVCSAVSKVSFLHCLSCFSNLLYTRTHTHTCSFSVLMHFKW